MYDGYHRHFVQDKADWDETDYTINYLQGAIDGELESSQHVNSGSGLVDSWHELLYFRIYRQLPSG